MITLGLDPHPGSHTVVALDESGVSLGHLTASITEEGLGYLHDFSAQFPLHRWAIEGAGNHFVSIFVGQLLARGASVFSISPALTSQYRARRGRKKNDVVDAANVARALLAGLDPSGFSGHSLRSGLATSAAEGGASERSIMDQTRHKSLKQVRTYIRRGSLFRDNAAARSGL